MKLCLLASAHNCSGGGKAGPAPLHRLFALCLAVVLASGCAVSAKQEYPSVQPEPIYEELFPYYAEVCAVSQIRAKFAEPGGSPGHAVMFLRGACKDENAPYPRLELCAPEEIEGGGRETGVGISVNKYFRNVNWMAVEGEDMFFEGMLEAGVTLDEAQVLQTLQAAVDRGIWKGIEVHEDQLPPPDTREGWAKLLASETLSTDFALRFGRHVYCSRLPMPRERLGTVVDYLNALNDEYATGEADYNWSGYADNCSHVLHNSLAAADVWKPQQVNVTKLKQLFNLSVPANEFVNLAFRGNTYPLENFGKIYRDENLREALLEGWLPTRHGAMLKYLNVHQPNELYETQSRVFVLEAPIFRPKSNRIGKMFRDPRYTQVRENLSYWESRYENILAERPDDWDRPREGDEREQARMRYYEYIQTELEDVQRLLARLESQPQ